MPLVSVIVPALDDRPAVEQLLGQIRPGPEVELIVADGGGDPELERISPRYVRTAAGRARQMNAGAAVATGEWLLFLHADSRLPERWLETFRAHTRHADAGWFRFALDDSAWQARILERVVAWRVRRLRLPYGDQGIFVRRVLFESMRGYRDMPLMEDVDFVRRLTQRARVVELPAALVTSARRWRRDGWVRRSGRNLILLTLYYLGVAPARLARWYG